MNISQRLYDLRKQHGYTLKEAAAKLGVSEGTMQRYEKGIIKEIPYDSITALADLYDVDPGYLMGWQAEYRVSDIKTLDSASARDLALLRAFHKAPADIQAGMLLILGLEGND